MCRAAKRPATPGDTGSPLRLSCGIIGLSVRLRNAAARRKGTALPGVHTQQSDFILRDVPSSLRDSYQRLDEDALVLVIFPVE